MERIEKEAQKIRRRLGELLRGVDKRREAEESEALKYRQARLVEAKELLEKRIAEEDSGDVLGASYDAGLSSPSRPHELFVACEAVTPDQVKNRGAGSAGFHSSRRRRRPPW